MSLDVDTFRKNMETLAHVDLDKNWVAVRADGRVNKVGKLGYIFRLLGSLFGGSGIRDCLLENVAARLQLQMNASAFGKLNEGVRAQVLINVEKLKDLEKRHKGGARPTVLSTLDRIQTLSGHTLGGQGL